MKKIIFLFFISAYSLVHSQDSKFYLGAGLGAATIGGDGADGLDTGLNINYFNAGFRFNESWGVTANYSSSSHPIEEIDSSTGIGVIGFGPMYTVSFSDNLFLDIKPQFAFLRGVIIGDDANTLGLEDINYKGNGFALANSLIIGSAGKGFKFSLDVDYLYGLFNEISGPNGTFELNEDNSLSNFKIGVGARYNF